MIRRLSDLGPVSNYRSGLRKNYLTDADLLEVSLKNTVGGNYTAAKLDYLTLKDNILKNLPMMPLGTVVYSNRSSTELFGLLPANGTTYTGATYPEFFALITSGKLPSISLTQYTARLTQYGSVGVYGYDSDGTTFRMMSLNETFIKSTTNVNNYGANESAGLPNISGAFDASELTEQMIGVTPICTGPFGYTRSSFNTKADGSTGAGYAITLDASKSSPIYGNSLTVTPNNVAMQAYVVVYTNVETAAFNLSGLQDALVYKADTDLNNITTLPISGSSGVATTINSIVGKKYTGPDVVVESWYADDGSAWYRKYKSGWLEQGGITNGTGAVTIIPFITAFSTTKIFMTHAFNQYVPDNYQPIGMYDITTTTFTYGGWDTGTFSFFWRAEGY